MRVAIRPTDFFRRGKSRSRIEVFNFGRNLGIEAGRIKRADPINPALTGDQVVPEAIDVAHSGIRPDLIRALKDAFPQVTMREIIDAAHSGLNPDDLRQAKEYSPNLTLPQIIRLKQAGVI